ncbi:MAG: hypothetical protein K2M34_02485, partial [Alphaproteobacteria bacterium]|nr:hypothetical protein [Alphaproteobacteria bacterium]
TNFNAVFDNDQKFTILIHKLSNRAQTGAIITKTAPMERHTNLGSGYLAIIEQNVRMSLRD